MANIATMLNEYTKRLAAAGVLNPSVEVKNIIQHIMGLDTDNPGQSLEEEIDRIAQNRIEKAIEQHENRKPIERITGVAVFCGLKMKVVPSVFKPYHDPQIGLDGGEDGLKFFRLIAADFDRLTKSDSLGLFQIGPRDAERIKKLFQKSGAYEIEVKNNYCGLPTAIAIMK